MMTMDNGIEVRRWEDFGLRPLLDHANPAQATFNHNTLHIPGLSGVLDFGAEMEAKAGYSIPVNRLVRTDAEITKTINELNRFFFDEFKQPRFIKTIFDYESNKYVWLKIAQNFTPNRATLLKKMEIPFVQHDDNKYSIAEANEIVWGNQEVDFLADYTLGNTGSGADNLRITSNKTISPFIEGLALNPYFEINGSGTNVKISCAGRVLTIGTFSNSKIEVDTENYIVYVNGVEKDFNLAEFYFIPGQSVSITGTSMNFNITFHYRDIYM